MNTNKVDAKAVPVYPKGETAQANQWIMSVEIRAENVTRLDNGNWRMDFAARPLTIDEQKFIDRMFPHTQDAVYRLLTKETVLGAIED